MDLQIKKLLDAEEAVIKTIFESQFFSTSGGKAFCHIFLLIVLEVEGTRDLEFQRLALCISGKKATTSVSQQRLGLSSTVQLHTLGLRKPKIDLVALGNSFMNFTSGPLCKIGFIILFTSLKEEWNEYELANACEKCFEDNVCSGIANYYYHNEESLLDKNCMVIAVLGK